ncbi:MAG: tRNA lysidine(34) synthetase TilS, partial [Deltaproteobacteria bacterium]|nr:tRNA lysidine(34) synthetase TilS [Deltaproteobacteria bacterium]
YLNIRLTVAHFNHGLRPKEDEKETEFVVKLAKRLDLALICDASDTITKAHGSSIEERAREVRYQFFFFVFNENHAQKLAIGHTMNDQAETVLMHFLRGTGLTGLSGIPPIRQNCFIRPLIDIKRDEIHTYLKQNDESFIIDSSNLETKYLRNKIRLELLPLLLDYQPKLVEHLGDLAFLCRQETQFIDEEAKKILDMITLDSSKHSLELSLTTFTTISCSLQYRIIRQAIKKIKGNLRKIDRGHIKTIVDCANKDKPQIKVNLPENIIVKKIYNRLRLSLGDMIETHNFSYSLNTIGRFQIQEINKTISFTEISKNDFSLSTASPQEAFLDLDKLKWPLRARNFRTGDKFIPLGVNGFKKVKDVFINNKIPSEERKKIPILVSRDDIVWVYGIRIDERYKIKQETKRILRCKIE